MPEREFSSKYLMFVCTVAVDLDLYPVLVY